MYYRSDGLLYEVIFKLFSDNFVAFGGVESILYLYDVGKLQTRIKIQIGVYFNDFRRKSRKLLGQKLTLILFM